MNANVTRRGRVVVWRLKEVEVEVKVEVLVPEKERGRDCEKRARYGKLIWDGRSAWLPTCKVNTVNFARIVQSISKLPVTKSAALP